MPKQLTEQHKTIRMLFPVEQLLQYETSNEVFLNKVITGDETWVHHVTPESKWTPCGTLNKLREAVLSRETRKDARWCDHAP
jgi:hypothetical protein